MSENKTEDRLKKSRFIAGCMRLTRLTEDDAKRYIEHAVEKGVNYFDHADIYDGGQCEKLFGKALKASSIKREDIVIQTKCGIVPGVMYDLSKKHIKESVEGSLMRLDTSYIDCLLLHRPDALMDVDEVSEAFSELKKEGKVLHFGVSNFNSMQIELLQKRCEEKIMFNQLQLGPAHCSLITQGLEVNMETDGAINRDGSTLDYMRVNNITLQAWSPFQKGFIEGPFLLEKKYEKLNKTLAELGEKYNLTPAGVAMAWLLRHPCNMQVVVGTMNEKRFDEIYESINVSMTREDWYKIYMASGNILP